MIAEVKNTKNRGLKILKLLRTYGPLSFRGIRIMMEPQMQDRRLHDAIARVYRKGLIQKREERIFRGAGTFYQLSQHKSAENKLADLLKCNPSELKQPYFRSRELIHTEACAIWSHQLKAWFPDAMVIRDYQFYSIPLAHEIMLTHQTDFELRPDILFVINGTSENPRVVVAFEIEKSRKSASRLKTKLMKYANETALDGLVYFCDSDEVSEPIKRIYESSVMKKSKRISHYGENFFLFQNIENLYGTLRKETFRNCLEPVSLAHWLDELKRRPMNSRRDQFFASQQSPADSKI